MFRIVWTMMMAAVAFNSNHNHSHGFICMCICVQQYLAHWCAPKNPRNWIDLSFFLSYLHLFAARLFAAFIYSFALLSIVALASFLRVYVRACFEVRVSVCVSAFQNQHWILKRKCVIYLFLNSMRSICCLCRDSYMLLDEAFRNCISMKIVVECNVRSSMKRIFSIPSRREKLDKWMNRMNEWMNATNI